MLEFEADFKHSSITKENFCKDYRWSPDGTKNLISTEYGEIFCNDYNDKNDDTSMKGTDSYSNNNHCNTNTVIFQRGEPIYDLDWYPYMNSSDTSTCCFVSTSKDHPIHLWDTDGNLRCTYRGHNQLDELDSALSVTFNLQGTKIYAGSNQMVRYNIILSSFKYIIYIIFI